MDLLGNKTKGTLTDFKDPFSKKSIERINFSIYKSMFNDKIRHRAVVEFKNGNTSGKQDIEADDFPSLVSKVDEFITSL